MLNSVLTLCWTKSSRRIAWFCSFLDWQHTPFCCIYFIIIANNFIYLSPNILSPSWNGRTSCLWGLLNVTSCFSNIVESIQLKIFPQILFKNLSACKFLRRIFIRIFLTHLISFFFSLEDMGAVVMNFMRMMLYFIILKQEEDKNGLMNIYIVIIFCH